MRAARWRGPWTWRAKWPLYAGSATALVGVVVAVVLVVPGGGGSKDQLLADDPTSAPTSTVEATPAPTPTVAGPTPTPTPDASAKASPTASAASEPPTPQLDAKHLLSNAYVNRAFGQGRTSLMGTWRTYGAPVACRGWDWEVRVARTWAWPDEIVAGETLAVLDSEAAASTKLAACREGGPYGEPDGGVSESLDLGDESYIATDREELYTQVHAGARLGRVLVVVFWRQSGPVTSSAPLEAALRAAVAKVREQAEGTPVAAPAQRTPAALRGFLAYEQVAPFGQSEDRWNGMNWRWDTRSTSPGLYCGDRLEAPLRTRDRPVSRTWAGGLRHADDGSTVGLTIASAAEGSDPAADFAACRERAASQGYPPQDISNLGDEAFVVDWGASNDTPTVYVRAGSTYLVLNTHFLSSGDEVVIARLALDRYLAASAP